MLMVTVSFPNLMSLTIRFQPKPFLCRASPPQPPTTIHTQCILCARPPRSPKSSEHSHRPCAPTPLLFLTVLFPIPLYDGWIHFKRQLKCCCTEAHLNFSRKSVILSPPRHSTRHRPLSSPPPYMEGLLHPCLALCLLCELLDLRTVNSRTSTEPHICLVLCHAS